MGKSSAGKSNNAITEKERRRHRRFRKVVAFPVIAWLNKNADLETDDLDDMLSRGSAIIATNHASVYDFLFVSKAARKSDMAYVASEHIMRVKPWGQLIARYETVIPHRKGRSANRTAIRIIERLALGESVYLAVEGEQTWDGITMDIKPGTGKLAKKSGASLVTYRIEGSYLLRPRWAKNIRRGKVRGRLVNVYTPEMLESMTSEEVDAAIEKDLFFDVWKWQEAGNGKEAGAGGPGSGSAAREEMPDKARANTYKCMKGGLADGLERAVCSCPKCRSIGGLTSAGDSIKCSCGFEARMQGSGFLESEFEGCPRTVAEWDRIDEEAIAKALEAQAFADDGATLFKIDGDHNEEAVASGRLSMSAGGGSADQALSGRELVLEIEGHEFAVSQMSNVTMVQAGRLLFSADKDYYEIRSATANLRKYMTAANLILQSKDSK